MRLTEHFTIEEMADPTTGEYRFADGFLDDLEILREAYAKPVIVNSACRSNEHNEWLLLRGYPASKSSFHLMDNEKYGTDTCAVDAARPNGHDLHRLILLATKLDWSIGLARTFVHLDRRARYTKLKSTFYMYA